MIPVIEIRNKINYLNERTSEYDIGHPTISDAEWDKVYFELDKLEKEYQIYFNDSPTQTINYQVVSSLEKIAHNHEMLSLEKTKSLEEIKNFLGAVPYLAMCKMDGLTCSLKYENGELVSAETRGDGKVGENILHNAKVIPTIPKSIPYKETLVIDGEIICTYHDFENFSSIYKNQETLRLAVLDCLIVKNVLQEN
jgi:DNA ligase (NAD+)